MSKQTKIFSMLLTILFIGSFMLSCNKFLVSDMYAPKKRPRPEEVDPLNVSNNYSKKTSSASDPLNRKLEQDNVSKFNSNKDSKNGAKKTNDITLVKDAKNVGQNNNGQNNNIEPIKKPKKLEKRIASDDIKTINEEMKVPQELFPSSSSSSPSDYKQSLINALENAKNIENASSETVKKVFNAISQSLGRNCDLNKKHEDSTYCNQKYFFTNNTANDGPSDVKGNNIYKGYFFSTSSEIAYKTDNFQPPSEEDIRGLLDDLKDDQDDDLKILKQNILKKVPGYRLYVIEYKNYQRTKNSPIIHSVDLNGMQDTANEQITLWGGLNIVLKEGGNKVHIKFGQQNSSSMDFIHPVVIDKNNTPQKGILTVYHNQGSTSKKTYNFDKNLTQKEIEELKSLSFFNF